MYFSVPNKTFKSIQNYVYEGQKIQATERGSDIWGFSGKAQDCQDVCAILKGCQAFTWKQWFCRLLYSVESRVCELEAISGIIDNSLNQTSEITSM